jgi:putative transposase
MTKSRHFHIWRSYHVTQRCHGRVFLLGKDVDRRFYLNQLWAAKRDWPVSLFAYSLTSNHVHLLLAAEELGDLSGFMAKVSGGMARHYNRRKERVGAFWEGRYRTTLIQDGAHLSRCLFYIEMNMVRAGMVAHPREWRWSSYRELAGDRQRYRLLDVDLLLRKLACGDRDQFRPWYRATLDQMSERRAELRREPWWGQARIVGDRQFVARQVDKRRAEDIVELDDGTCVWA